MTIGWFIIYLWLISLLVFIFGFDFSLILIFIILVSNSISGFMYLELFFVVVLLLIIYNSSTYERSGSYVYLAYFSLVISFALVGNVEFNQASWFVILVIFANLPIFGLHVWLPKVHVEASILSSIFLAGLILNGGTVLYYLIGEVFLLSGVLMVMCSLSIIRYVDGKGIVAISSVLHMGSSIICIGIVYIISFTHIVVSPLIFFGVYICYVNLGSRMVWSMGSVVLLVNLGFPCLGAFFCEIFICYILLVFIFVVSYYLSIIFTINIYINDIKNINGWLVGGLLCLVILW